VLASLVSIRERDLLFAPGGGLLKITECLHPLCFAYIYPESKFQHLYT
jgi:hypothetical protein